MEQRKIGIMGGTFDPIHNGHILIAKHAYEIYHLDEVIFIPSGVSYLKSGVSDAMHRLEMTKLSIKEIPYFSYSTMEIERKGNTYTFETLEKLHKLHPDWDLYFILGADQLLHIDKWYQPQKIFQACTLICSVRDDSDIHVIQEKGKELEKMGAKILYLDIEPILISSTNLRQLIKNHQSIDSFVPKAVASYILQEHLYEEN